MSQLSNYQFDIKYRPGKNNVDADFLSHNHTCEFEERLNRDNDTLKSEDIGLIFAEASREKTFAGGVNVESLQMEEQGKDLVQSISRDRIICAQKNDDESLQFIMPF